MDILQGPDNDTMERIKSELKEDQERFDHNLQLFEKWVECQPHLPKNYDKRMLRTYLRASKHDLEKAKSKLEKYFLIKKAMPVLFQDRDPESKDVLEAVEICDLSLIPKLSPEGYRVTVCRMNTSDPSKFRPDLLMKRGGLLTCLRTVLEKPTAGDIIIFDADNLTAVHAATFLTPITRRCIVDGPEAYPNRIRQLHVVNTAPLVEKLVTIVKTLLKDKLKQRLHVHVKPEKLHAFLPPECLPNEYGGTAGNIKDISKKTHDFVVSHFEWFKEQNDVNLIGPLPEKYNFQDDFGQGADGSFRKLAID